MARLLFCALILSANSVSFAAETTATILRVLPTKIVLGGLNREQQIVVTAISQDGQQFDVTHRCQIASDDPVICVCDGTRLQGRTDGETSVRIRFESLEQTIPVKVAGYGEYPPVHFRRDVIPLLSKTGCNNGGCHGKAAGQNGFKLSVFGFDAVADLNAMVKEGRGRRLFHANPKNSLLLLKATGQTPHGGGQRIRPDSPDYLLIAEWIKQGTPWGDDDAPQVARIEIEPHERVLRMRDELQILVTAVYEDGARRDVTSAAAYLSNAETVAKADEQGHVQTGNFPGEAAITINYMGQVAATKIIVPLNMTAKSVNAPTTNRIDELVVAKLEKMGISQSPLSDDATFLRRLYLDTIGTLPSATEVRRFITSPDPEKREQEIESVLKRPEFTDYWTLKLADVLLADSNKLGERGAYEFHQWLRTQIATNRPYNEWVRELITASGYSNKYGPVNFYRAMDKPEEMAKAISQAFLGIRLDCAQCHHHPFDRWGQEDFFGMAGFFNGLERRDVIGSGQLVFHKGHTPSKMPLTDETVKTRALGQLPFADLDQGDPRIKLADWVTSPENPWFARLLANRLWKSFLGRGLVEPEDDLRSTNPSTNEALLAHLTEQVIEAEFDMKSIIRLILNSRTYQLSSDSTETNAGDRQNFSHYFVRRMPAEVLLDAISQVAGSAERFPGMPPGTRSIQLWDNRLPSYFLDTFGRSQRSSPCECGKSSSPTMAQALHLMNAPEIESKIGDKNGRIVKLVSTDLSRDHLIDELCLTAIGRPPRQTERKVAERLFSMQPPQQAAEDFLWTLLNSYDFLFIK
ncbi:MAG: DUF1549 and DUF1553 domain-containing protein [Pirellulaceae bacterium]